MTRRWVEDRPDSQCWTTRSGSACCLPPHQTLIRPLGGIQLAVTIAGPGARRPPSSCSPQTGPLRKPSRLSQPPWPCSASVAPYHLQAEKEALEGGTKLQNQRQHHYGHKQPRPRRRGASPGGGLGRPREPRPREADRLGGGPRQGPEQAGARIALSVRADGTGTRGGSSEKESAPSEVRGRRGHGTRPVPSGETKPSPKLAWRTLSASVLLRGLGLGGPQLLSL